MTDLTQPYVVHMAGYNFAKFRQGLNQPYDPVFQYAMLLTMNDLVLAFQAATGYTHLFDIVLVFDKNRTPLSMSPMILLTMYTSYATLRFNHHMAEQIQNPFFLPTYPAQKVASVMTKQTLCHATFVENASLMDWLVDRCYTRAYEQTVALWAQVLLGADACQGRPANELVHILASQKGIRWALDVPPFMTFGVFGKMNMNTNEPSVSNRCVLLNGSSALDWLFMSHWENTIGVGDPVEAKDIFNVGQFREIKTTNNEAAK